MNGLLRYVADYAIGRRTPSMLACVIAMFAVCLLAAGLLTEAEVEYVATCEPTGESKTSAHVNSCGKGCIYTTDVNLYEYDCHGVDYWSQIRPDHRGEE